MKKRSGVVVLAMAFAMSLAGGSASAKEPEQVFYTISGLETEVFTITVSGGKITTADIGPTHGGNCASLAVSPLGKFYSMCGPVFGPGPQRLATIDPKTGLASPFGVDVARLSVMAMVFAPNGILYAVGGCNPDRKNECIPASDPNYNSLYTVNTETGAFTRVGSTGAPQFFMDLAIDGNGNMFGVTSTVNPSMTPAILYRIDPAKGGAATKVVDLVGSSSLMGLDFGRDGKLYATDFTQKPGLYLIAMETGFETAIAALPFDLSSSLKLAKVTGE